MTKGRVPKVIEFGLEQEVVELLKQGMGPKVISDTLNKRHNLTVKLNHVNIISFRNSLPSSIFKAIKNDHLEQFYVKPIEQLRGEMEVIRDRVYPELLRAIELKDARQIRVLEKVYVDTWDRVAKMEELINPTGEMKAKVIHIQQQFNLMKGHIEEVFSKLCPECRAIVLSETEFKTTPPVIIDAVYVDHEEGVESAAPEISNV